MVSTTVANGIEISFRTSPANRRELVQTLEALRERVLASNPECECEVSEDLTEPNLFHWWEWWPEDSDTTVIARSERFQTLLGAIRVLGALEGFHHVTRSAA